MNLEQKVMALISHIGQELDSYTNKMLTPYKLSSIQLQMLDILARSDKQILTVNQIKEALTGHNPNVSRSLNKMMDNGLIEKQRSTEDQRVVYIKLTETGTKTTEEAINTLLEHAPKPKLNNAELKQLFALLQKF